MLRVRLIPSLGLAVVVGLALVGCSNTTAKSDPTATPTAKAAATATATPTAGQATSAVTALLKEFTLTPDKPQTPSGSITFRAQNVGTIQHDLLVVRTDLAPADLPMQTDGTKVDESKLDIRVAIRTVDAGKTDSKDVRLAPGKYILLCNTPAHYKSGMASAFVITP